MKLFNIIFSGVFALFALLQINDPDPYLWIPIYGFACVVCFLNYRNKYDRFTHLAGIIFCLGFGMKQLFTKDGVMDWMNRHNSENLVQSMKATKPWIENTREFGGLMIILIVLVINIFLHKKAGAK
jgi:hypothetical protein